MSRPSRPVLRYHGGKFRIARWLMGFFPPHRIYVEPYGGAASVLLAKPRSFAEVYNDLDDDVVNVFRVLRNARQAARLKALLELTPWSRREFFAAYQTHGDPIERARRTIVRCFMAFGSTSRRVNRTGFRAKAYRQNQTGVGDWLSYIECLDSFTQRMRRVVIESRPALEVIQQQDTADTLFYVDPPYPHVTRPSVRCQSDRDRAYAHDMDDAAHHALAEALHAVSGMVVISGYPCALYDESLYADWERHERAALADQARPRTEVVWLNPACSRALAQVRSGGLFACKS